ncbi:hypothetical protein Tco_1248030 [Tanacetum coccineum]
MALTFGLTLEHVKPFANIFSDDAFLVMATNRVFFRLPDTSCQEMGEWFHQDVFEMICLFLDGSKFHNHNLQAILANSVVSCLTLSDQGYAEDFYDQ